MNKEESIALFGKGKEAWNSWAEEMRAKCEALQANGDWNGNKHESQWNDATMAWLSAAAVDFTKHQFENLADFRGFLFPGDAWFQGAAFHGDAEFRRATFARNARFEQTTFFGGAGFLAATFSGDTRFDGARFSGDPWFEGATFAGATWFEGATFAGATWFEGAEFSVAARFQRATFAGPTMFLNATFTGNAWFGGATFSAAGVAFRRASFSGYASFVRATFSGGVGFLEASFSGNANFREATYSDDAQFEEAIFYREAEFRRAEFSGDAWFKGATFDGTAGFQEATFAGDAEFRKATFSGDARFTRATFTGFTSFQDASFKDSADFAAVEGKASFSLAGATFGVVPDFIQANFAEAPRLDDSSIRPRGFWSANKQSNRKRDASHSRWTSLLRLATPDPDLSARWRALKKQASEAHDHEREQLFFRNELKSRRWIVDKPWSGMFWFGVVYELFSDFGRSLLRPAIAWLVGWIGFACVYLHFHLVLAGHSSSVFDLAWRWIASLGKVGAQSSCIIGTTEPWHSALGLSLRNALVFVASGLNDRLGQIYRCLYGIEQSGPQSAAQLIPVIPETVAFLSVVQGLYSSVMLFLFLLALRNHFRIK